MRRGADTVARKRVPRADGDAPQQLQHRAPRTEVRAHGVAAEVAANAVHLPDVVTHEAQRKLRAHIRAQ